MQGLHFDKLNSRAVLLSLRSPRKGYIGRIVVEIVRASYMGISGSSLTYTDPNLRYMIFSIDIGHVACASTLVMRGSWVQID